jgi:type VI secretion system secreted protein Hcp
MALNAYLRLKAEKQGDIKGSVTQKGREDAIQIIGYSHEIVSPRDAASGLPTGKRQHKPLVITKEIDKSSALLYDVLTNNENIQSFRLDFYQPSKQGIEKQHFTIQLFNANIASIRSEMLNNRYPENMQHDLREHVAFTYQKISWTWQDGGVMSEDDWETPRT